MWNIDYSKKGTAVMVGQEEHLIDAVRIAQAKANEINHVVNVHKRDGHYKVIHPQRKVVKCITL